MKRTLIIKNSKAKVIFKTTYLEISTIYEVQYIGLNQLESIYINKEIKVPMNVIITLAKNIPIYFIDSHGIIIAKISFEV